MAVKSFSLPIIETQVNKPKHWSLARQEAVWAYVLISPWIIGFLVFNLGPMAASFYFSFTDYNIVTPPTWIGLANFYNQFFNDPIFWHSLLVTLKFGLMAWPLNLAFSLSVAVMLNQKIRAVNFWRTVYFLPSLITGVAVAVLWSNIFHPTSGILNPILALVGIQGPFWLQDPRWALKALVIINLWGVGGSIIIYLAGLQGIPTDLYDAAQVDGANAWRRFWHITLPMMSPVIFYNVLLGMIGMFQYFTEAYVLTSSPGGALGEPVRSTLFYNLYLFQNAFRFFHMGYASAMAWFLFLIVLALTMFIFKSSQFWVYYEGQLRK